MSTCMGCGQDQQDGRIACQMMMAVAGRYRTFGGPACGALVPEDRQSRGPWLCDMHIANPFAEGTVNATIATDPRVQAAIAEAGRDQRIYELRARGLSHQQIADRLADEGYGRLTRGRIAQIVAANARTT